MARAVRTRRVCGDDFYDSREWNELRYEVLRAYEAKCQCCGRGPGKGVSLHVDHIKPRSKFPELELEFDNLQILCSDCNIGKSNKDASDWRKEEVVRIDKKWVTKDPTVRLPWELISSKAWMDAGYSAQSLYVSMRASMFNPSLGVMNVKYTDVRFGPTLAKMNRKTYYGAMAKLISYGLVKEVAAGGHGKKAVYDLTTRDWVDQ